jgi:hypothetical protein
VLELGERQRQAVTRKAGEQPVDVDPAGGVERDADLGRLVAEDEAEELAGAGCALIVHAMQGGIYPTAL